MSGTPDALVDFRTARRGSARRRAGRRRDDAAVRLELALLAPLALLGVAPPLAPLLGRGPQRLAHAEPPPRPPAARRRLAPREPPPGPLDEGHGRGSRRLVDDDAVPARRHDVEWWPPPAAPRPLQRPRRRVPPPRFGPPLEQVHLGAHRVQFIGEDLLALRVLELAPPLAAQGLASLRSGVLTMNSIGDAACSNSVPSRGQSRADVGAGAGGAVETTSSRHRASTGPAKKIFGGAGASGMSDDGGGPRGGGGWSGAAAGPGTGDGGGGVEGGGGSNPRGGALEQQLRVVPYKRVP